MEDKGVMAWKDMDIEFSELGILTNTSLLSMKLSDFGDMQVYIT